MHPRQGPRWRARRAGSLGPGRPETRGPRCPSHPTRQSGAVHVNMSSRPPARAGRLGSSRRRGSPQDRIAAAGAPALPCRLANPPQERRLRLRGQHFHVGSAPSPQPRRSDKRTFANFPLPTHAARFHQGPLSSLLAFNRVGKPAWERVCRGGTSKFLRSPSGARRGPVPLRLPPFPGSFPGAQQGPLKAKKLVVTSGASAVGPNGDSRALIPGDRGATPARGASALREGNEGRGASAPKDRGLWR